MFKAWQGGEERLALLEWDAAPNFLMLRGPFTDRGLARLRGLDGLFALNVDDARLAITAGCLDTLRELPRLARLSVDATDAWMPGLATLPHLRFLSIQDTTASDAAWVALARSRTIEQIWGRRCHGLRGRGSSRFPNAGAARAVSQLPERRRQRHCRAAPLPCPAGADAHGHPRRWLPAHRTVRGPESLILMSCRDTTDAATEHLPGLSKLTYYFNSYTTITDRTPEILSGSSRSSGSRSTRATVSPTPESPGSPACRGCASCESAAAASPRRCGRRFRRRSRCTATRRLWHPSGDDPYRLAVRRRGARVCAERGSSRATGRGPERRRDRPLDRGQGRALPHGRRLRRTGGDRLSGTCWTGDGDRPRRDRPRLGREGERDRRRAEDRERRVGGPRAAQRARLVSAAGPERAVPITWT